MVARRPFAVRAQAALPVLAVAGAALAYTALVVFRPERDGGAQLSADAYWADYPNLVYALRALREGHGLLWNRLQNCGQPFLASTLVGLFYPLHALVVPLGPERGMFAIATLHFAIAGLGAYALGRELGCERGAALCSAFAFELGGAAVHLGVWLPYSLLGVYAWMPVAVWRTERLLRLPTVGNALALGVVLTLQLLIGYPQLLVFTGQVVVLRTLWECARRDAPRARLLATVALGIMLPAFLGAAQLLPMLEFAHESVRNRPLHVGELGLGSIKPIGNFANSVSRMFSGLGRLFTAGPTLLAGVALARTARWRTAVFYGLLGALYLALAFDTPVFALSRLLPFGRSFRWPQHALVVTALGYAVLVGVGADGLLRAPAAAWRTRLRPLAGLVAGAGALVILFPVGLTPWERWETALCVALVLWLASGAPGRWLPRLVLPAVVMASVAAAAGLPFTGLGSDTGVLYVRRPLFADLAARTTVQDRVYQVGRHVDYTLARKSASVFGVPSITDYEPQTSKRYAEFFVMMLGRTPMTFLSEFEFHPNGELPQSRPLFDLVAARYLAIDLRAVEAPSAAELARRIGPGLDILQERDGVAVLENRQAMPRAFFVPRVRTVASPAELLQQLASDEDIRREALVEEPPERGPAPVADATGEVEIVADRSEEVVLRVRSTGPGYVFLSDQDYPGWGATVDGVAAPIQRADFAFRLVAVPAGASTVVFRYRPASVRWGLGVSAVTLLALAGYVVGARLRAG